jgi:DNA-3-methyladenine glycosylase I
MDPLHRCSWVPPGDELYARYHDEEWGVPEHDDRRLFELLTLEGAQAGLSWRTILGKREAYCRAFRGFEPAEVAGLDPEELLRDAGIVRNRLKVASTVANAARVLEVQAERGSFDAYAWSFVDGEPLVNRPRTVAEVPAETPLSRAIGKDMKRRGFRFVGPTVIYSFMQAAGLVDDHVADCFRARGRPVPSPAVPSRIRASPDTGSPGPGT